MTLRQAIARITTQEDINFLLTNRIPRRLATRLIGWFSKIEQPLVARASIATWRLFSDVDLSEAASDRFTSMHDCFTRRLRPGARRFDRDAAGLASPCDAIVGAHGRVRGDEVLQIKGFPYRLGDLFGSADAALPFHDGNYVTLRLTAGMYHHFHAPADMTIERVTYLSGDCWNVNPIALKRVERLFCRNERAVIVARLADGRRIALVAVAAILVAGIRLTFLDTPGLLRNGGPRSIELNRNVVRGEELGWFEHGSTIILFAGPGYGFDASVGFGSRVRASETLLTSGLEAM